MQTEANPTAPLNGPDPFPDRAGASTAPSRSLRLLGLVRGLIAFGQALLQTLHQPSPAGAIAAIASRFGTRDLALIVARITRGLMLAAALDARLVLNSRRLDTPPAQPAGKGAAVTTAARKPAARSKALSPAADDAALLARLPTAQEIAAHVRRKPIGVVLEQICHDLGITCDHPLWSALNQAIIHNGGSLMGAFNDVVRRVTAGWASATPAHETAPPQSHVNARSFAPTGTGPP